MKKVEIFKNGFFNLKLPKGYNYLFGAVLDWRPPPSHGIQANPGTHNTTKYLKNHFNTPYL